MYILKLYIFSIILYTVQSKGLDVKARVSESPVTMVTLVTKVLNTEFGTILCYLTKTKCIFKKYANKCCTLVHTKSYVLLSVFSEMLELRSVCHVKLQVG